MIRAWLCTLLLAVPLAARAEPPQPAHGVFVSHVYAIRLRAAIPGLTYCRVPEDWTGSDHGTILFLVPPRSCEGVGYPSSSRGFEPGDTPRIEFYYGRTEQAAQPCHARGAVYLLGRHRPLCPSSDGVLAVRSLRALYVADSLTEATFTLVTPSRRLPRDVGTLRALAASAQVCSEPWHDAANHPRRTGWGPPCPPSGDFY